VDESDVYVDVHKAIRRLNPAPRARRHAEAAVAAAAAKKGGDPSLLVDIAEHPNGDATLHVGSYGAHSDSGAPERPPKTAVFMKRRSSAGPDGQMEGTPTPVRQSLDEMRSNLRLGPANRAANPMNPRMSVFKIKQGLNSTQQHGSGLMPQRSQSSFDVLTSPHLDERSPLLTRDTVTGATTSTANKRQGGENNEEDANENDTLLSKSKSKGNGKNGNSK
jgi:metal transporter CNNM